jgi:hypothetical protein
MDKNYVYIFNIKEKRAIIYLLPRKDYFKVAMIFGEKATQKILKSNISDEIKKELESAKAYVEGRGIRIDIKDASNIVDITKMIDIKLQH